MKKIIIGLFLMFTLVGCGTSGLLNTPTKKVEMFFSKYQSLDNDVLAQINKVASDDLSLSNDQKDEYVELMKKHYQALKYEIKDETIDGDSATVTAEIEVMDYSKILDEASSYRNEHEEEFLDIDNNFDESLYNKYRIEQLKKAEDTVKYNIEITLSKIDGEWVIDDIPSEVEDKIQGVYKY